MQRSIRNRLTDLLLGAFGNEGTRLALLALDAYCQLAASRASTAVPLRDLLGPLGERAEAVPQPLVILNEMGLLRLCHRQEGMGEQAAEVEAYPQVREALPAVCERVRRYRAVMVQDAEIGTARLRDRTDRVLAESALCFNAGLFFEAHEHLEQVWVSLPRGRFRDLLQGIIQVSVGFHHAERGSYEGAVNQLSKGLAKLRAGAEGVAALDVEEFARDVQAARERIAAWGRKAMRPVSLAEVPRIRLRV